MAHLTNPNELKDLDYFAGLIIGQPGVGKTVLGLSGPDTVLIDADQGMKRIAKRFQVPSLQMDGYKQFLALLDSSELDPFKTITIDTIGKLVDRIGDYLGEENPKNRKSDGALTQAGYGALKVEFARLVRLIKKKKKHLIFIAHEKEEKDGDVRIIRADVVGSSGKDLVKDLDFMGYMEMRGNKRTISFTPTEKFYAKNSLGLPPVIDVPDIKSAAENNFIQKYIIEKAQERMREDAETNGEYERLIANVMPVIDAVKDGKSADEALATISIAPVIWDSLRVMKYHLMEKTKAVGVVYDRDAKKFIKAPVKTDAPAEEKAEGQPAAEVKTEVKADVKAETAATTKPVTEKTAEEAVAELKAVAEKGAKKKATAKPADAADDKAA